MWREKRGIQVFSMNINPLSIPDEQKKITEWEENAMTLNPQIAAARLVGAQADAMRTAAGNTAGAAVGFMGMSMAQGAGGVNAQNLYAMGTAQLQRAAQAPQTDSWQYSYGGSRYRRHMGMSKMPQIKQLQVLLFLRRKETLRRWVDLFLRRDKQRQILFIMRS